ncbi:RtcB family protein [Escherichia coli]|nr:RtcB family protein [Escherichia coli]
MNYELLTTENVPVKMWTKGVPVEDDARQQLINTAKMPFIFKHIAVMPDVHLGKGSTIGSVIPTKGAIIPAAVGEYLADQLVLPMALAGTGEFTVAHPSCHLLTNIAVVERFLPVRFSLIETDGVTRVSIE